MIPAKASIDVGLVVSDLEAMRRFYTEVLSLAVLAERETGWGAMVELGFGEGIVRLLRPPEPPPPGPVGLTAGAGIRYLTFEVADFDEAVETCRAQRVPFEVEVLAIRQIRIAMVRDPEGNVVELLGR